MVDENEDMGYEYEIVRCNRTWKGSSIGIHRFFFFCLLEYMEQKVNEIGMKWEWRSGDG